MYILRKCYLHLSCPTSSQEPRKILEGDIAAAKLEREKISLSFVRVHSSPFKMTLKVASSGQLCSSFTPVILRAAPMSTGVSLSSADNEREARTTFKALATTLLTFSDKNMIHVKLIMLQLRRKWNNRTGYLLLEARTVNRWHHAATYSNITSKFSKNPRTFCFPCEKYYLLKVQWNRFSKWY